MCSDWAVTPQLFWRNDLRVREKTSNLYALLELIRGQNSSFNLGRSPGTIPRELSDNSCWNLSCEVRRVLHCPSPASGSSTLLSGTSDTPSPARPVPVGEGDWWFGFQQGGPAGFRVTWCKRIRTRAAIIQISSVTGIRAAICWPLSAHAVEPCQTLAVSSYPWLHPKRTLELILSTSQRSTRGRAFTSCHRPYWFIFARIRTST